MVMSIEVLEQRIESLRTRVRQALMAGERDLAGSLRGELRRAQAEWDEALDALAQGRAAAAPSAAGGDPGSAQPSAAQPSAAQQAAGQQAAGLPGGGFAGPAVAGQGGDPPGPAQPGPAGGRPPAGLPLPVREQVYQALTLLTVPAAPKLISSVHEAFFAGAIFGARLTSLRRDEERSFRTAPFARPFYLCAALTADLLAPARGLLAVSTWSAERRVIGPLSPRVDFLTAAIAVAEGVGRIPDPSPAALRLLWRFASNIPGGMAAGGTVSAPVVARAAQAERRVHADADLAARRDAARRARTRLDDAQQLFGTRLRVTARTGTAT